MKTSQEPASSSRSASISGRRSARSQMVRQEAPKTNPIFPIFAILTLIVALAIFVPMGAFFMAVTPENYASEDQRPIGRSSNNYLSNLAQMIVGFSPEPDEETFEGDEWLSISEVNQPDVWYYEQYRGVGNKDRTDRWKDFEIDRIDYEDDEQRIPRFAIAVEGDREVRYALEATDGSNVEAGNAPGPTDVVRPQFSWNGR